MSPLDDKFFDMDSTTSGTWFICTLSKQGFKNWDICKEISAWGIASGEKKPRLDRAKKGDYLIIYGAGKGLVATAIVTGPMRRPESREEAPWAGGIYRYGAIVPFKILVEPETPVWIPYTNMIINGTSIHTSRLQKGFSMISGVDGNYLLKEMKKNSKPSKAK